MSPTLTLLLAYFLLGLLFLVLADWLERHCTVSDRSLTLDALPSWLILIVWLLWPFRAHRLILATNWRKLWTDLRAALQ